MLMLRSPRLRGILRWLIPGILIPLVVLGGAALFHEKRYLFLSGAVAVLSLLLFSAGIERKEIGTRRMVLVSVLVALCIAGRMIPFFKPITALTILAAMYLGCEAGFLTGAMAALLSNFYFGQGPWTPFQMFAWGMIGFAAGLLGNPLRRSRAFLLAYGVLSGILYSLLMDVWTVLWYQNAFDWQLYLAAVTAALPHTLLYAVSNLLFLWWLAKSVGEKLERVKVRYGV